MSLSREDVKGCGGKSPHTITHNYKGFSNYDTVNMLVKADEPLFSRLCRAYAETYTEKLVDAIG